jgi:WD40 repeat protein
MCSANCLTCCLRGVLCTQVFDAGSRSVLRQLKGHSRPVHVTRFAADKTHVLSGGDDVTLRWWDIGSGKQLLRLVGHEDYVRAAAASASSSDTWASGEGGYSVVLVWAGPGVGGRSSSSSSSMRASGEGLSTTEHTALLCICVGGAAGGWVGG